MEQADFVDELKRLHQMSVAEIAESLSRSIVLFMAHDKMKKVYSNPANPWESVVEPGESSRTWNGVAISIL